MNLVKSLLVKLLKMIGLRQVVSLVWYKVIVPEGDKRVANTPEEWDNDVWEKIKEYVPKLIALI